MMRCVCGGGSLKPRPQTLTTVAVADRRLAVGGTVCVVTSLPDTGERGQFELPYMDYVRRVSDCATSVSANSQF